MNKERIETKKTAVKESEMFKEFCAKVQEMYDDQFSKLDVKNYFIYLGTEEKKFIINTPSDINNIFNDDEAFDVDNLQISYSLDNGGIEIL